MKAPETVEQMIDAAIGLQCGFGFNEAHDPNDTISPICNRHTRALLARVVHAYAARVLREVDNLWSANWDCSSEPGHLDFENGLGEFLDREDFQATNFEREATKP